MNKINSKFLVWLLFTEITIFFIWQLLELILYKEIQPRLVDDIIGFIWTYYLIVAYRIGYYYGNNNKCNH